MKVAEQEGYDNIEDLWIIKFPEKDYAKGEGEGTRNEHDYETKYKAKNSTSIEGDEMIKKDK